MLLDLAREQLPTLTVSDCQDVPEGTIPERVQDLVALLQLLLGGTVRHRDYSYRRIDEEGLNQEKDSRESKKKVMKGRREEAGIRDLPCFWRASQMDAN